MERNGKEKEGKKKKKKREWTSLLLPTKTQLAEGAARRAAPLADLGLRLRQLLYDGGVGRLEKFEKRFWFWLGGSSHHLLGAGR